MQPLRKRNSGARLGAARSAALLGLAFLLPALAFAAGNIDSTQKYAWGNTAGWVNFAPANGGISVSDSSLTGYAWSAQDGWINFSPANGGVSNSGGTLSGYAWDSAAGWVSFSGVSINTSTGRFTGTATGANGYQLSFDCTNCAVSTSWRPATQATQTPGAISPITTTLSGAAHAIADWWNAEPTTPLPAESESSTGAPASSGSSSGMGAPSHQPATGSTSFTHPSTTASTTLSNTSQAHNAPPMHAATSTNSLPLRTVATGAGVLALLAVAFFVLRWLAFI